MISVCIPVYNTDVRKLAGSLKDQAANISAEVILIDDGSREEYREMNRSLQQEGIRYYELDKNIGRSRIRNRFTTYARERHLLFLDCDSVILSDAFLAGYVMAVQEHSNRVICGGTIYDPDPPPRKWRLQWKYGNSRVSRPVPVRMQDPDRSFMTNNFLIPAEILKETPFDERLSGYGHEDTLFGFTLARKGREIIHIDNPVVHGKLESNREFVDKTREAVHNLIRITEMLKDDPGFTDSITLLETVRRLEGGGLAGILRMVSVLMVPISGWLLRRGCISLRLLDVYKLGLFLILKNRNRKNSI